MKSTATTATITGLTNGPTYEVQVRAGNSAGDGAWSASATGTPVAAAAVPSAPSAPRLTAGDGQVGVRWTAPSDNGAAIDDYDVRYRTGGGSWTELPDAVKSTSTTATITEPDERDRVRGSGSCGELGAGDGEWSASATGTPAAATSEDRAALVEFYNATNGANWNNNTNWKQQRTTQPMARCLHEQRPRGGIGAPRQPVDGFDPVLAGQPHESGAVDSLQ